MLQRYFVTLHALSETSHSLSPTYTHQVVPAALVLDLGLLSASWERHCSQGSGFVIECLSATKCSGRAQSLELSMSAVLRFKV